MTSARNRFLYGCLLVFLTQVAVRVFSSTADITKSDIADESVDISHDGRNARRRRAEHPIP